MFSVKFMCCKEEI